MIDGITIINLLYLLRSIGDQSYWSMKRVIDDLIADQMVGGIFIIFKFNPFYFYFKFLSDFSGDRWSDRSTIWSSIWSMRYQSVHRSDRWSDQDQSCWSVKLNDQARIDNDRIADPCPWPSSRFWSSYPLCRSLLSLSHESWAMHLRKH